MFIAGGSELCDHTNMYLLLLSEMVFLSVWSSIMCNSEVKPDALLNGSSVTYIPAGMEPVAMTYLKIFDTSIQILDLRQLLPYTSLYKLEIQSSPVKHVISAHLPLTYTSNKMGNNNPPWLTMLEIEKCVDITPFRFALRFWLVYRFMIMRRKTPGIFLSINKKNN